MILIPLTIRRESGICQSTCAKYEITEAFSIKLKLLEGVKDGVVSVCKRLAAGTCKR